MTLPTPKLTPPVAAAPGRTRTLFAPMLAIVFSSAAFAPLPISIIATTDKTPMITPRAVKNNRILFRRRAFIAVRNVGGSIDPSVHRGGVKAAAAASSSVSGSALATAATRGRGAATRAAPVAKPGSPLVSPARRCPRGRQPRRQP